MAQSFPNLLQWSIENIAPSQDLEQKDDVTKVNNKVLEEAKAFFFGRQMPSEAQEMQRRLRIILSPEATLEAKDTAFDDLETQIGQIDNANNLEKIRLWQKGEKVEDANGVVTVREEYNVGWDDLTLWAHFLKLLEHETAELRAGAASCIGTAVSQNERMQKKLFADGAIPTLVKLVIEDDDKEVRSKAAGALSRASRNCQPNLDAAIEHLPDRLKPKKQLDAGDMDQVDILRDTLKAEAARKQ